MHLGSPNMTKRVCCLKSIVFSLSVENVSFSSFSPGFLSRFLESHAVMFTGNAGLKPKEGEYTSRPGEWPINIRVRIRKFFCHPGCSAFAYTIPFRDP